MGPDTLATPAPVALEKPLASPRDFAEFEFQAEAGRKLLHLGAGVNLDGNNMSTRSGYSSTTTSTPQARPT